MYGKDFNANHFEGLKRFIASFEQLNPFAMDYFFTLLFKSYQEVSSNGEASLDKRKQLEVVVETALKNAKVYIAQQEAMGGK